ncbi:MAG TPA: zf-HC2 domain-containing protein [Candidatus Binataceae bacterium]|nr:zf-HC2 domain-containing protein [Candidatus Binataceae bacterium]
MKDCEQIAPLLGAFQDGELDPQEMRDVARHLAMCKACEAEMADYGMLGDQLRKVITVPPLDGFAAGVNARLDAMRPSFGERVGAFFEALNQRWAAAFAMVSMAGAVAVVTALVLTPYLQRNMRNSAANVPIAKAESPAGSPSLASAVTDEGARSLMPSEEGQQQLASTPDINPGDSQAVINRLESQIPTTAVWSEPEHGTTVIWLPSDK